MSQFKRKTFCWRSAISDRGLLRREVDRDHQGRRPDPAPRRGAGPDRRIRRRQVDHRPAAAMGYARDGTRISGGSIEFDGMELTTTSEGRQAGAARLAHRLCRAVGGGVLQPGAQADRPAHRGAGALPHQEAAGERRKTRSSSTSACACRTRRRSASAIRTRCPAVSCSGR
jgi:hypothetical protein